MIIQFYKVNNRYIEDQLSSFPSPSQDEKVKTRRRGKRVLLARVKKQPYRSRRASEGDFFCGGAQKEKKGET